MKYWAILLCCLWVNSGKAQQLITGKVIIKGAGQPVPGVSIFINNTSAGTITKADGSFQLTNAPEGDLIVSSVSYETEVYAVKPGRQLLNLHFELRPRVKELENITVGGSITETWEKWGAIFMEAFLGTTPTGKRCELKNKKAVRFRYYKNENILRAVADEPLKIVNPRLGYKIQYDLQDFQINFNEHRTYYAGYALFRSSSGRGVVKQGRRNAYYGSPLHFMRAVYEHRLDEEGFRLRKMVRIPNVEKERVKEVRRKIMVLKNEAIREDRPFIESPDSVTYYNKIMSQADYKDAYDTEHMTADSIIVAGNGANRVLYWNDFLVVTYINDLEAVEYLKQIGERRDPLYPTSFLQLREPLTINSQGNWTPPKELISSGYWSWSDKVGNMLPLDYEP
ncbi:carboxypeptidase-like regulatory domain-containing protein [Niabella aurantiaca]|uniref:carboxypeptidase-like regulatory domain-containing protein n=1 Tax=Niabella aurantiaca TaxID=379900 RepID=UPI00036C9BBA|nr:carboxypeptidase-like regulatory domain-containing protein [Niabella aurantiaca]